ncbi:phage terminase small subunit [Marinobacter sp. X15-166B]|uniref:phage terminase small subunit n=1 Tax=Marinobacter sp. X15-166B TaxID=1897620 RepID=UPI00085C140B|nr:phage terminase small subunit [Marinobacter sp. X15-166B]OEY67471.1 hypothetical protein BG841_14195 [Marinobacter sp. X15-166B]
MTNPARKHFLRVRAAREAATATPDRPQGQSHELHRISLVEDVRALHDIQSIERKIEAKRDMLPRYESYVQGVLEAGTGQQDDVLVTLMVWYLDIGDLKTGLDIAEYAIQHGIETPDKYARTTATLAAEEVAEYALRQLSDESPSDDLQEHICRAIELFADADMQDQVKAKLFKAHGYLLRHQGNDADALTALQRALELNERVGVKKDIQTIERKLKDSGE